MKRAVKEAISGIALISSFIAMIVLNHLASHSYSDAYGIAILLSVVVCIVSMIALVTYSKTGWSVVGSRGEWNLAIGMNPGGLVPWNRNYKEQVEKNECKDRARDEEYYRNRPY